jgi:hypothetical protein
MIPVFDFRPGYERHRAEFDAAIARVLASGQLILGPEVRAFEEEFAGYVDAALGVGVASGTDALVLALRALGIGPGDEVITVANAGVPPVAAIRAAGATPRFVDVHPDTLLLDPGGLERACSERTRCILPVHLYGHPVEMDAILDFARSRGLRVVEDCAQAHGARHRGKPVGGFGEIGCFSFYPTKNLGAFGDAGMCVTDDPKLAESLRMLRMYGFRDDRHAHREGLNSRLDELQAAITPPSRPGASWLRATCNGSTARVTGTPARPVPIRTPTTCSWSRSPSARGSARRWRDRRSPAGSTTRSRFIAWRPTASSAMAREICRSPSGLRGRCCRSRSTRDSRMRR